MTEIRLRGELLRCVSCGSTDILSIKPGHDRIAAVIQEARRAGDRRVVPIPTEDDEPTEAHCAACCPWFRAQPLVRRARPGRPTAQLDLLEFAGAG